MAEPTIESVVEEVYATFFRDDGTGESGTIVNEAFIKSVVVRGWNARGAADAALIDQSLSTQMGHEAAGPYVKNLTRELKALDR